MINTNTDFGLSSFSSRSSHSRHAEPWRPFLASTTSVEHGR